MLTPPWHTDLERLKGLGHYQHFIRGGVVEGRRGSLHGKAKSVTERREVMGGSTLGREGESGLQHIDDAVWKENRLGRTGCLKNYYHNCADM